MTTTDRFSRLPLISALVAFAALALLAGSGPLRKADAIGIVTAIDFVKWSGMLAIGGAVIALLSSIRSRPGTGRKGLVLSLAALMISAALIANLLSLKHKAENVPPIHDITTDTEDPPLFKAVLAERSDALNPAEYEGAEIAAQQRQAYPDLGPLDLALPPEQTFAKVQIAAKAMKWKIVSEDPATLTLEATDTTPWLGFKDDVVVRVRSSASGSRIDARSLSRIGQSDLGKNAERLRAFFAEVKKL